MKKFIVVLFLISGSWLIGQSKPVLNGDEVLLVDAVKALQLAANNECQSLEAVKKYNELRIKVEARIKQNHPNEVMNWQTFQLMEKK